jgi:isovaleryl-CoA dehydrogenase
MNKYIDDNHEVRSLVKTFARKNLFPYCEKNDQDEHFFSRVFLKMQKEGLLSVLVPTSYNGLGMTILESMIVHEEMAYFDPSTTLSYLAHCILCTNNILINGNDYQKKTFIPKLCDGEHIGAMALSEANAGSDIMAMKTNIECEKNKYILNGNKMWITNGVIDNKNTPCHILYLYSKFNRNIISSVILENNIKGFSVGQKIKNKLGMRSSPTAELIFDQCVVPSKNIVSKGSSIRGMMRNLQIERLALAAIGVGITKFSLNTMINYSRHRKTFNNFIYNYGQIQNYIANSYADYMACKTYLYSIAKRMKIEEYDFRIESDSIKLISGKLAKNVSDYAIQVLGGNGYTGEYHVERFWRDAKLLEIGGGTNEILQKNITRDLIKSDIKF